jgi:glutathione S-transferase
MRTRAGISQAAKNTPQTTEDGMKLYGYWRSQATYRVRVAMNLKGIPPSEDEALDLAKGDQFNDAYRKVNPQMVVPALIDDPRDRARVRALALIPIAEIHPLMVPRVRNYIEKDLQLGEAVRVQWIRHWVGLGLSAMETLLATDSRTGKFSHGDAPTMADICLAGQVIGAQNSDCDVKPYPTVLRIFDACMALDAFSSAHPRKQPDAPKTK